MIQPHGNVMALVAVASLFAQTAIAADKNISIGNDFYYDCAQPANQTQAIVCMVYVRGLVDALHAVNDMPCVPAVATYQQRYDVLMKFLKENPSARHHHTVKLLQDALFSAFCMVELEPLTPRQ